MNMNHETGASIWLIRTGDQPEARHLELLTPEESVQCGRFRQPERRARYAAGRALLRRLLSERLGVAPTDVPIEIGDKRRPQLSAQAGQEGNTLDFNLSSTPGFVACAIARGARVGIDIEDPARAGDMAALAQTIFTAAERAWWSRSTEPARDFCRLWTLKESVAKADGEGIGLPFGELTLLPNERGSLSVDLAAMGEDVRDWHILELATQLPAALALRWTGGETGPVNTSPAWPPGDEFDGVRLRPGASLR